MSNRAKKEYLDAICARYRWSSKKEKQNILDEFCQVCGYPPRRDKYAIRLLRKRLSSPETRARHGQKTKHGRSGRPAQYDDPMVLEFLMQLWRATNLACSKRLKAIIPLWLPFYDRPVKAHTIDLLMRISPSTIDRLLRPMRARYSKPGLATPSPVRS